jgi:hypothetical protein
MTLRIASTPALTFTSADPLTPAQLAFGETWRVSKEKSGRKDSGIILGLTA